MENQDDGRRTRDTGWHLKREVNASIIISVIGIAIAAVMGYSDLKRDIALIQADMGVLHQRDSQISSSIQNDSEIIRRQFERIDAKLDRLIERKP